MLRGNVLSRLISLAHRRIVIDHKHDRLRLAHASSTTALDSP
ncbi:MAG TPA: hypothetical protein VKM54_03740 [Myxococcota bacterium]|nr:hypothetical protein [Myxococcota bacterium]